MAYIQNLIDERDDLIKERDSLNDKMRAMYAEVSASDGQALGAERMERIEDEAATMTERRNELDADDGPIAKLNEQIEMLKGLAEEREDKWADAPTYTAADPVAGGSYTAAENISFTDLVQREYAHGEATLSKVFDKHGTIPVSYGAEGLEVSLNAVGATQVPFPNLMRYGVRVAMATGYAIDLVPTRTGPNMAISWNEANSSNAAGTLWRSTQYASPTNYSPTAPERKAAPAEFAVEVQVSIQDDIENPNIGELANRELMKSFKDEISPAFIHEDNVSNVRTAIGKLSGNGTILAAVNWQTIGGTTASPTYTAVATATQTTNLYDSIRNSFVLLQQQYPGQKTMAIPRWALERIQEYRTSGIVQYPELRERQTDGLQTVTARGVTWVPIDVGFEAPGNDGDTHGKVAWTMTDFDTNTELVTTGVAISRLTEIQRREGKVVLLLDGAAYWRVISRFGVATGVYNGTSS